MPNVYKTSYGVSLCRYNANKNNQPEILMIKKRFTYSYFSFIFGYYKKDNDAYLRYLFNNMTSGEKVDILSMKFSNMWYRLWLAEPEKNYNSFVSHTDTKNIKRYLSKKSKFESIFLKDAGVRLCNLINNSTNSVTPWEIPKGAPNLNELDMNCAVREFEEETSIKSDNYNILWGIKPIISTHKDDDIIYRSVYYTAYINKNSKWVPNIKFNNINQLSEVDQIQWIALDDIKFLNLKEHNKKRLVDMFKKIIYVFKKNIKSYYYNPL